MFMQASPAVSGGFSFADLLPQKPFNLKEIREALICPPEKLAVAQTAA